MQRTLLCSVLLLVLLIGTACSAPAAPVEPASDAAVAGPQPGGTIMIAYPDEPATLDPHLARGGGRELTLLGATLVAKEPQTGAYVPYLAKSWTVSEDGLVWEFVLRDDVTFHNGDPLTAQDYAWTFQRMMDPALQSPAMAAFQTLASAEAVDATTLRLTLNSPYYALLESLELGFAQPLSRRAVEAAGAAYGRNPVGVGPFKFKTWETGVKIVLERNPDFAWAPAFLQNQSAPYLDAIEVRYLPEYATIIAGLEAGEIDVFDEVQPQDIPALAEAGFQISDAVFAGSFPYLSINVARKPFDDIKVRQALNYAIDKDALIKVVMGGQALPQAGPLSSSVHGYEPEIETIGYSYDPAQAQALLSEAGYAPGALALVIKAPAIAMFPKVAEVLQSQLQAAGFAATIQQGEYGAMVGDAVTGNYDVMVAGYEFTDADVLHVFFHSSNLGAYNISQLNDPALDAILDRLRTETDPDARQVAASEAQRTIVEQAYVAPLFTPINKIPVSSRLRDVVISSSGNRFYYNDAYLAE